MSKEEAKNFINIQTLPLKTHQDDKVHIFKSILLMNKVKSLRTDFLKCLDGASSHQGGFILEQFIDDVDQSVLFFRIEARRKVRRIKRGTTEYSQCSPPFQVTRRYPNYLD